MDWCTERRQTPGRRVGDIRNANVLHTVGSDIAILCRQVASLRTAEGTPRDVRDRLEIIDRELARLARLTGDAVAATPEPRLPADAADVHRLASRLTEREWDCLELLVRGMNTNAMARQLGVSSTTVRTHVQSVLAKLCVNSRLQAVALATRTALFSQTPYRSARQG
ncbi:MAG TPA: LuxR C-terminal-related transcriptional regulator [Actinophytocola sp.]|nr:LuxR C-terminal-related transcriptional regulator [Actinophytocola sp.]